MVFNPANAISEQEAKGQGVSRQPAPEGASPSGKFNPDNAVKGDEARQVYLKQQGQKPSQETIQGVIGLGERAGVPEAISKPVGQYVVQPLFEIGRGFQTGGERLWGDLDAVTELIGRTTGTTNGGLFEEWSKSMGAAAQQIPETDLSAFDKLGFNLVGGFIPISAELALVKVPQAVAGMYAGATDVTKFAILGAIDEYKNDPERRLSSLPKGAVKGAAASITFQTAGASLKLLQHGGEKAAEAYLTWLTNSRRAAKRLLSDGGKRLNLNPLGQPKNAIQIKEENTRTKQLFDDKAKTDSFAFRQKQKAKSFELTQDLTAKEKSLAVIHSDAKNNLKTSSGLKIEETARVAGKAVSDMNNSIKNKAVNLYDAALQRFSLVKRQAGGAVENAVNAAINNNPGASVPYKLVNNQLTKTVRKFSPFEIKKGKVLPRTGATKAEDTNMFQRIIDDFKSKKAQGGLSIKYLQDLKKDLNNLSTKYFKAGDNQLGKMYNEMSKTVNPANIVSKNRQLQSSFSEIHQANREYADLVPKYEAALKYYFKNDASGTYIPDPNKAFNAVAGNDRALLREMEKADRLLAPNDRLLPKIRELDALMNKNIAHQKGITQSLKRQTQKNAVKLQKAKAESMRRLKAEHKNMTAKERERAASEIRVFSEQQTEERRQITHKLDEQLKFYQDQDALRKFAARTETGAGIAQRIIGFSGGLVGVLGGEGVTSAVPAAIAGVTALSPIGAANVINAVGGTNRILDETIGKVLRNKSTKDVLIAELIRNSKRLGQKEAQGTP